VSGHVEFGVIGAHELDFGHVEWNADGERLTGAGGTRGRARAVAPSELDQVSHEEDEGRAERPGALAHVEADERAGATGHRNVGDQRAVATAHEGRIGIVRLDEVSPGDTHAVEARETEPWIALGPRGDRGSVDGRAHRRRHARAGGGVHDEEVGPRQGLRARAIDDDERVARHVRGRERGRVGGKNFRFRVAREGACEPLTRCLRRQDDRQPAALRHSNVGAVVRSERIARRELDDEPHALIVQTRLERQHHGRLLAGGELHAPRRERGRDAPLR
jgi:hypothetical protein